jgi:cellulose synthase/poly-beta-1,6-N-acetylglucosamine synthase-like glycosyltransferase
MNTLLSLIVALAQAIALLMSVAFISYAFIIVRPFMRDRPKPAGKAESLSWHFFVPALNEDRVIGQTIDHLRATFPRTDVWVIDDASDDDTAAIIGRRADADPLVHLVPRRLPEARTGKGDALNAAYRALGGWLPSRTDRSRTIIGVVDADGRLAPNCLDVCAGLNLFGDADVGSVQVLVRMLNRADRRSRPDRGRIVNFVGHLLNRLQDLEFRVPISAIQVTRRFTGTVGLGGNGQFSRLSALDVVADRAGRPWRGALLDDYELSLHLMLTGHRNAYTQDTYVDQEALPDVRRLIRQRTRWGQGTMQCGRYLRELWTSDHVSRIGALEATYYLSQPWLQLIGTFVYPVPFILLLAGYLAHPVAIASWVLVGGWMAAAYYLTFGVGPFLLWGPLYRKRCEPDLTIAQALGLGLAYSGYVLMIYITSWRALIRIVRGEREWFKTRRNAEFIGAVRLTAAGPRPVPRPVPVGIPQLAEAIGDAQ